MQQHYLPKMYLKHFADPQRPGQVWLYRRGRPPVSVGIGNVAKEKNIYTFRTRDGRLIEDVEAKLSRMESDTASVLARLNQPLASTALTRQERTSFAWFTAFLLFRTRAMRRAVVDMTIQQAKDIAEHFGGTFDEAGSRSDPVLEKLATIEALSHTDNLAKKLLDLGIEVLRSVETPFILPDRPVSPVAPPERSYVPDFFELFVPIGSHTVVLWSTLVPPSDEPSSRVFRNANVVASNSHSLGTAVEFIISPQRDPSLADAFTNTAPPSLIRVDDL